jgi:hypothetical protein
MTEFTKNKMNRQAIRTKLTKREVYELRNELGDIDIDDSESVTGPQFVHVLRANGYDLD